MAHTKPKIFRSSNKFSVESMLRRAIFYMVYIRMISVKCYIEEDVVAIDEKGVG